LYNFYGYANCRNNGSSRYAGKYGGGKQTTRGEGHVGACKVGGRRNGRMDQGRRRRKEGRTILVGEGEKIYLGKEVVCMRPRIVPPSPGGFSRGYNRTRRHRTYSEIEYSFESDRRRDTGIRISTGIPREACVFRLGASPIRRSS